jgi:hypothetical protein
MPAERPSWAPQHIDLDRPNAARIYDYLLGGACNFERDREFAKQFLEVLPDAELAARRNRAFLRRAVRFCVEQGIRQFIDIGSGIPTVGNVHEIAQGIAKESRVLYVDNEPVAVAHSELMLDGNDGAAILHADLADPDTILGSESAKRLINFDEPVGLLMVAVLHFIPDSANPQAAVRRYLDAVAPGSFLVVSHGTSDGVDDLPEEATNIYNKTTTPGLDRSRAEILEFMSGTTLVEPGIVWTVQWRPDSPDELDDHPERSLACGVVGQKT